MCDYSLYVFSNRLAQDGEELVVHRFSSGCIGFISALDVSQPENHTTGLSRNWDQLKPWFFPRQHHGPSAVCIPPGAQIELEGVECELGLAEREPAVLIHVTAEEFSYRDGLRFRNGRQILLQALPPGQRARIISTAGLQDEDDETAFTEVFAYE